MTGKSAWVGCALLLALGATPLTAQAQNDARLADARQAYAAVDYENTRALAKAAIERGGNDRSTTGELYFLWALAAAALEQAEEARAAFGAALAVNPELKVARGLSPKLRAPYQEARGALTRADGRPPLEVAGRRREGKLELSLLDTQGLVDAVELSTRAHEGQPFTRQRFAAAPIRSVTVATQGLEFFVNLLDRHGNVVGELGNEAAPARLPSASGSPTERPREGRPSNGADRTPYYVTAAALGALGVVAGGVSTTMYFRRESAAKDWNGPGCEKPGFTRSEQCAKVDDRRRSAEHLSIGFAAAGGALLVGGVVTWLLAPASEQPSVAIDTTANSVMLGVRTAL